MQVLSGLSGAGNNKLTLGFEANKAYTQVACKNSSGTLVIYVPGDIVLKGIISQVKYLIYGNDEDQYNWPQSGERRVSYSIYVVVTG